ncbi:MAG: hypothetical protein NVSMB29_19430 [Candidatus Dormibacteria bacterium]
MAAAATLAGVALVGCGQPDAKPATAQDILRQTAQNTTQVRSANLEMRMSVAAGSGSEVGFTLAGAFAAAQKGQLPVVRTDLTQFVGAEKHTSGFISTGSDAFVTNDGGAYTLPAAQVAGLRGSNDGATLTSAVHFDQWAQSPALKSAGQADGVKVDTIHGTVGVAAFFNDLVRLTQGPSPGAAVPQIAPGSEADLAKVVQSSSIELSTGQSDRVLRHLHLEVAFTALLPPSLQDALKNYAGAQMTFDMSFSHVNQAVRVTAPPAPRPYSELVRQQCRQNPSQAGC